MTAESEHPRYFLIVLHTGRADSVDAAVEVCLQLVAAGAVPVLAAQDHDDIAGRLDGLEPVAILDEDVLREDIEFGIVLGGDGTILRAAELVRDESIPLLGVNLGHVGFLAESEREDLSESVSRVLNREYLVEERMTLDVAVHVDERTVYSTWALNEATVEKASRERMLEVIVEIDGLPLSSFGCDGMVMSTPTGSTAYAFSAGGPIVWPSIEAILLVPLSPHALFARPLVIGSESSLVIELMERNEGVGVLWCDGRRSFELPPGSRVETRKSDLPVRLARLKQGPFSDRLVNKFHLPVSGWRGPHRGPDA